MLIKKMKFMDYNGEMREEEFRFNLNRAELLDLNLGVEGGLEALINKITETRDVPKLAALFKKVVLSSYGEKSADGRRFIKSQELRDSFEQTEAFSDLIIWLYSDEKNATSFINGIVPGEDPDKPKLVVLE